MVTNQGEFRNLLLITFETVMGQRQERQKSMIS